MDIKIGSPILVSDGEAGKVERIILHPETNELEGIVAAEGGILSYDVVVPASMIEDADENGVRVHATSTQIGELEPFAQSQYTAAGGKGDPKLAEALAPLTKAVAELEKNEKIDRSLVADVAVYAKAVDWALRHDEFIIERKGKPLAALVPVERLEQMRRFARQHALEVLERQREGSGDQLSDEEAMDVALAAQRAARRQLRKPKPGSRRVRK